MSDLPNDLIRTTEAAHPPALSTKEETEVSELLHGIIDAAVTPADVVPERIITTEPLTDPHDIRPKTENHPSKPPEAGQSVPIKVGNSGDIVKANHDMANDSIDDTGSQPEATDVTPYGVPTPAVVTECPGLVAEKPATPCQSNGRPEKLRYSVRNDTTRMFFTSRSNRSLLAALRRFSQKIGDNIGVMRWTFDGVRVREDQTPENIGMEVGQDNVIWAFKEAVGGGAVPHFL